MSDVERIASTLGLSVAPWMLRLPIIRHIRAAHFAWQLNTFYDELRGVGFSFAGWTGDEKAWWEAIKRGEA